MNNPVHPANPKGNGGYERRDIGSRGVLYFLAGMALAGVLIYFIASVLYSFLEKRSESQQAPVNPLVMNAPKDTRRLSADYKDYLKQSFPSPQLEIDERGQLDKILTDEAQMLGTYDWIDQKAGTVRIPIDRAMELIAQRGLPTRTQPAAEGTAAAAPSTKAQATKAQPVKKKGTTK